MSIVFLFEFNKGVKTSDAAKTICTVYGEDAIGERTAMVFLFQSLMTCTILHFQEDDVTLIKIV